MCARVCVRRKVDWSRFTVSVPEVEVLGGVSPALEAIMRRKHSPEEVFVFMFYSFVPSISLSLSLSLSLPVPRYLQALPDLFLSPTIPPHWGSRHSTPLPHTSPRILTCASSHAVARPTAGIDAPNPNLSPNPNSNPNLNSQVATMQSHLAHARHDLLYGAGAPWAATAVAAAFASGRGGGGSSRSTASLPGRGREGTSEPASEPASPVKASPGFHSRVVEHLLQQVCLLRSPSLAAAGLHCFIANLDTMEHT